MVSSNFYLVYLSVVDHLKGELLLWTNGDSYEVFEFYLRNYKSNNIK